jgi:hypothetical protein
MAFGCRAADRQPTATQQIHHTRPKREHFSHEADSYYEDEEDLDGASDP